MLKQGPEYELCAAPALIALEISRVGLVIYQFEVKDGKKIQIYALSQNSSDVNTRLTKNNTIRFLTLPLTDCHTIQLILNMKSVLIFWRV